MADAFDCIVIGSGPGGYVAAVRAAQLGLKTAVVEKDAVGGRCLNYACIPAKAVLRAADALDEIGKADEFGLKVSGVEVDFDAVQARRAKVVKTLTGGVGGLFSKNEIELVEGEARLTGGRGVAVGDRELEAAKALVIATGSVKRPIPGTQFGGRVDRRRAGRGTLRTADPLGGAPMDGRHRWWHRRARPACDALVSPPYARAI